VHVMCSIADDLGFVKDVYSPAEIEVPSKKSLKLSHSHEGSHSAKKQIRMEPGRRELMEAKQMGIHSVGSKDVEKEAAVPAVAAPDSSVESILQAKQVEEELVSLIRIDPDPENVEEKVVVDIVVAAAMPEPTQTLGPIHFVVH
jgi:hypothetical protein